VLRLAAALAGAGREAQARAHLEAELKRSPHERAVRSLLSSLYRGAELWKDLVALLLKGADSDDDPGAKISLLLEAADIQQRKMGAPGEAVALLRKASALSPQDRALRTGLADALRGAGEPAEAKALLEALIDEYGRRRPPERAAVHYQLAQLARSAGDLNEALAQLETASSMDIAHAGVLELLGELSQEAGQLERAERAYRALLLTLRRQRPDGAQAGQGALSQGEVLLALSRISQSLSQPDRAGELLESAFEAAAQGPHEAARFERALRAAGEHELLLRSQEGRLARARNPGEEASVLAELAVTLEAIPGREAEAFATRLRGLSLAPESAAAHAAIRALASRADRSAGLVARYAEHLTALAEAAATERKPRLAGDLWMRLGEVMEGEGEDLGLALAAFEKAEAAGEERKLDALHAIDRVAAQTADRAASLRALRALAEALADEFDPSEHVEVLYRLAALELADTATSAQGAASLAWAIDREPRHDIALTLLREAASREADGSVLALYERVARLASDDQALLDALEQAAMLPTASTEILQEAVDLAARTGENGRAEALLRRAVEIGLDSSDGPAVWAMVALSARRKQAGDLRASLDWLNRAAEVAPPEEAVRLGLEAAALAEGPLGDLDLAAASYERLWQRDVGDRRAWEPLLALYRRQGNPRKVEALIAAATPAVVDSADRRHLRMEHAELLLASKGREDEAVAVLDEMLDEDPDDADASGMLMGLLERTGKADELCRLLARQLDGARARRDLAAVSALSLRLGELLAPGKRDEAMAVFREAVALLPDDRVLLEALLALFQPGDDPRERAQITERLLAQEHGEPAARLALQLADAYEAAGDEAGVERALASGASQAPDSAELRARLERWLIARKAWPRLAEMLLEDAARKLDPKASLASLRRAAQIYLEELSDPRRAAEALRRARALAPEDLELLKELTVALSVSGQRDAAVAEVAAALDALEGGEAARPSLLRLRAGLSLAAGGEAEAVADLEQAVSLGDRGATAELLAALEQRRVKAASSHDAAAERQVTLRLCELLSSTGEADRSRDVLASWAERHPEDHDALRALLTLDAARGAWEPVAHTAHKLLAVEQGEARIQVALRLAEACGHLGQPDAARGPLEAVYAENPAHEGVRDRLRILYEQGGQARELAGIFLGDASAASDDAARFEALKKAGELYLTAADPASAIPAFEAALHLRSTDHDTIVHLADALTAAQRLEQATALLDASIAAHKGRRSAQVSVLQHRMARVAYAAGDRSVEMAWLGVALDSDMQNGQVASELADVTIEFGHFDLALKALRAVTMMKNPGPMTKAQAYLRQGMIAYHQGDPRKAVVLAKKAQSEDPNLAEVRTFLEQIGEK
jgi:tetratricopeptide (TPR) repeat protein